MTIKEAVKLYWKTTECETNGNATYNKAIPMERIWENRRKAESVLMQKSKAELVKYILQAGVHPF